MSQLDMFSMPAPAPVAAAPSDSAEIHYTIVLKGDRLAINWQCGEHLGVIGGLYDDEAEALRAIEFRRELREQGVRDPRPWMRIPPEGLRP